MGSLDLNWITKADHATCFEIYIYESSYVIHGELEITRLDKDGRIMWQFSGSDIFTTPTDRDDFKLKGDVIEAVNWDGIKFMIERNKMERHIRGNMYFAGYQNPQPSICIGKAYIRKKNYY